MIEQCIKKYISGTELYFPPEMWIGGTSQCGPFTIWTLGVVLFHIMNGTLPFGTNTAICRGKYTCRADLSPGIMSLDMGFIDKFNMYVKPYLLLIYTVTLILNIPKEP